MKLLLSLMFAAVAFGQPARSAVPDPSDVVRNLLFWIKFMLQFLGIPFNG